MDFIPKDVQEAADKAGGNWIKASEFEGKGLVLQVSKPMEKVKSNNPKYGAQEKDYLVKTEILEVGETFHYTFMTPEGNERQIDSASGPMFIGFKQCEELGVGDWVQITREGERSDTRFTVEKVDAPSVSPRKSILDSSQTLEQPVNPEDIPF